MPSVTRMRTSPRRTGIVVGRRGGSSPPPAPPLGGPTHRPAGAERPPPLTSRPVMLPTPSQVPVPSSRNAARPTAAPRVARSASWQRHVRASTSSHGSCRRAATATSAASLAGAPWPRPSIAATSARRSSASTSASSPERSWPGSGRPAVHHSRSPGSSGRTARPLAQALELVALAPLAHGHRGAAPGLGLDGELVHESLRAGKPEPEAVPRGVALAERLLDVGDPRPPVAGDDLDAEQIVIGRLGDRDLSPSGVVKDVAPDLGDRGRDERRVRAREPEPRRQGAPLAARLDDVRIRRDLESNVVAHDDHALSL